MFEISDQPLDTLHLAQSLQNPKAGALATFEGWVRNHNDGHTVEALEYEAFADMACKEGNRILEEAKQRFDVLAVRCMHRVGKLAVGDLAVWVGAVAPHRKEAFEACQYVINQVKHRVPIWKKEHYTNGHANWVNCQQCASSPHIAPKVQVTPEQYYARQCCLPDVGRDGQEKLRNARVLVIGAGGLGCSALLNLATAGVGTLHICDFDLVDGSNLHRQMLYTVADIGKPKALVARERLMAANPFVTVHAYAGEVTLKNAPELFEQVDLVLDCTDNFATRFLLSDMAVLQQKPLIQAGIYQYEGQIQFYRPGPESSCLRCLWPQEPDAACIGNCAEVGVFGAVAGLFGTLQAVEAIKFLLEHPDTLPGNTMLTMDLLTYQVNRMTRPKNPQCHMCSTSANNQPIMPSLADASKADEPLWLVNPVDLTPEQLRKYILIDIREPQERLLQPVALPVDTLEIPVGRFSVRNDPRLQQSMPYLLFCSYGVRSAALAKALQEQGCTQFYSLKQGITGLKTVMLQSAATKS